MYKIRGADQMEYGPVARDQILAWIKEGRANAQTLAQDEGTSEWKPLSAFSEFGEALAAKSAGAPPPKLDQVNADALAAEIIARDYHLDIGSCFRRGWELVKKDFWLTVCASALVFVIYVGIECIPFVGWLIGMVLGLVLFRRFGLAFSEIGSRPAGRHRRCLRRI